MLHLSVSCVEFVRTFFYMDSWGLTIQSKSFIWKAFSLNNELYGNELMCLNNSIFLYRHSSVCLLVKRCEGKEKLYLNVRTSLEGHFCGCSQGCTDRGKYKIKPCIHYLFLNILLHITEVKRIVNVVYITSCAYIWNSYRLTVMQCDKTTCLTLKSDSGQVV